MIRYRYRYIYYYYQWKWNDEISPQKNVVIIFYYFSCRYLSSYRSGSRRHNKCGSKWTRIRNTRKLLRVGRGGGGVDGRCKNKKELNIEKVGSWTLCTEPGPCVLSLGPVSGPGCPAGLTQPGPPGPSHSGILFHLSTVLRIRRYYLMRIQVQDRNKIRYGSGSRPNFDSDPDPAQFFIRIRIQWNDMDTDPDPVKWYWSGSATMPVWIMT